MKNPYRRKELIKLEREIRKGLSIPFNIPYPSGVVKEICEIINYYMKISIGYYYYQEYSEEEEQEEWIEIPCKFVCKVYDNVSGYIILYSGWYGGYEIAKEKFDLESFVKKETPQGYYFYKGLAGAICSWIDEVIQQLEDMGYDVYIYWK